MPRASACRRFDSDHAARPIGSQQARREKNQIWESTRNQTKQRRHCIIMQTDWVDQICHRIDLVIAARAAP
jgi:hypothetical protein